MARGRPRTGLTEGVVDEVTVVESRRDSGSRAKGRVKSPLEIYLEEINATPLLSAFEELSLGMRIESATAARRRLAQLMTAHVGTIAGLLQPAMGNDVRLETAEVVVLGYANALAVEQECRSSRALCTVATAIDREVELSRVLQRAEFAVEAMRQLFPHRVDEDETVLDVSEGDPTIVARDAAQDGLTEISGLLSLIDDGDLARDHFARANLRLVVNIARSFQGRHMDLLDLIQEGNTGVLRAVEGFDPSRQRRFSTYASPWVKQSIRRALGENASVRVPAYQITLLFKWRAKGGELQTSLGRAPTDDEIANALNFPADPKKRRKKIGLIRKAEEVSALLHGNDEEGGEAFSIDEMVADRSTGAGDPSYEAERNEEISRLLHAVEQLGDERQRLVLEERFGLKNGSSGKTLKVIGKELDLTRERVRQIEAEALASLVTDEEEMDDEGAPSAA